VFSDLSLRNKCLRCDPGYFLVNLSCSSCLAGYKCEDGQTAVKCAPGTYQNQTAQSRCNACPYGSVQPQEGQPRCSPCIASSFLPISDAPLQCRTMQSGYYGVSSSNSAGYIQEVACAAGFMCSNGLARPCPAGTYQNRTTATECTACEPGTFSNTTQRTSTCLALPSGHYTDLNRTTNLGPCPSGSYCTGGVQISCPAGSYQDLTAQSSCKPCGDSAYFAFPGRNSKCLPIPEGYYGVGGIEHARTDIAACLAGSYCIGGLMRPCTTGFHQPNTQQQSCIPCVDDCPTGLTWMQACNALSGRGNCSGTPIILFFILVFQSLPHSLLSLHSATTNSIFFLSSFLLFFFCS
jgi:hypothetical protein